MAKTLPSPAQIRGMFGANLRHLAKRYASISDLSRQLGINRTQFNRYLAAESFPRPDVLARICAFFDVDARILLEPVETLTTRDDPIANPVLDKFIGVGARDVPIEVFPDGFYRFSRRSFVNADDFVIGLVYVWREGSNTYLRGYEARSAMRSQGLTTEANSREFRAIVMQQENGIAIVAARHNSMTCSFNYLSRVASFENNYWVGYVTRTVPEHSAGPRVTRLSYEHLGSGLAAALPTARQAGLCRQDDLPEFHQRLLRPEEPFR